MSRYITHLHTLTFFPLFLPDISICRLCWVHVRLLFPCAICSKGKFPGKTCSTTPNLQVFKFLRLLLSRCSMNVRLVCCFLLDYIFQQMSGAALFNLSLLTSDMWAVVVRIFIYRQEVSFFRSLTSVWTLSNTTKLQIWVHNMWLSPLQVDWLYYLSFSIVVIGLVVYLLMYIPNLSFRLSRCLFWSSNDQAWSCIQMLLCSVHCETAVYSSLAYSASIYVNGRNLSCFEEKEPFVWLSSYFIPGKRILTL